MVTGMKPILLAGVLVIAIGLVLVLRMNRVLGQDVVGEPGQAGGKSDVKPASPLDFVVKDIDGKEYDLAQLKGKVVMVVNVASKCGFTKQYAAMEKVYDTYKDRGFVLVAFPANNFKGQEPGSDEQIKEFCTATYGVSFPLMSKISVKGEDKHPVYKYLTEEPTGGEFKGEIGWNFTKFLIDRDGRVYARFASKTTPDDAKVVEAIEKGLSGK